MIGLWKVLGAVLAIASSVHPALADGNQGSFIGCSREMLVSDRNAGWIQDAGPISISGRFQRLPVDEKIRRCILRCKSYKKHIAFIGKNQRCGCSATLPPSVKEFSGDACTTAVFYPNPWNDWRCSLADVNMTSENFIAAYSPHNLNFSSDGTMTLKMTGTDGVRVTPNDGDYVYGMYQTTVKVSAEPGVVSAFYLRSDYAQETKDFSEIDFEFINGEPGVPDSVWLNYFVDGKSRGSKLLKPDDYKRVMGARVSEVWVTYVIDWSPRHVAWYMNDEEVHYKSKSLFNRFRSPYKPSHVTYSIWTANGTSFKFGGHLKPEAATFSSSFRRLRRVLCSPGANYIDLALPQWMLVEPKPGPKPEPNPPKTNGTVDDDDESDSDVPPQAGSAFSTLVPVATMLFMGVVAVMII